MNGSDDFEAAPDEAAMNNIVRTDSCPAWCLGHFQREMDAGPGELLHGSAIEEFDGIAQGHLSAVAGVTGYYVEFLYHGKRSSEELRELADMLEAMAPRLRAAADHVDGVDW